MPDSRKVVITFLFLVLSLIIPLPSIAEIPQQLNFQGRLLDNAGAPVANGTYSMTFTIHEEAIADTPLWTDTQDVLVINGIYNALLPGDPETNPFTEPVKFGRYLAITVGTDLEMTPRQTLTSTLFCFLSSSSEDSEQLHGNTLSDLDDRYVNEGQAGIVNSDMIEDGSITSGDLAESYISSSGGTMSGGLIMQGSLAVGSHVSRPFYNTLGTGTPVSGHIRNEYDLFIADDLETAGNVFASENLYVGTDNSTDDDYIYFDYSTLEFIRWEEDLDDNSSNGNNGGFYLSDDLEISGNLGIGTSIPTENIHIDASNSGERSFLKIESSHQSNWGEAGLRIETPQNMWHLRMDDDSNNNIPAGSLSLRNQNSGTEVITWDETGNVGIGTTTPNNKLDVAGTIRAEEIIVDSGWADYVFQENYTLMDLEDVENYIKQERHLPQIPSESEVKKNGISLGLFQAKILQKVEELTLHVIEQNKEIKKQHEIITKIRSEIIRLQKDSSSQTD